jgi:hypothetical protein
VIVGVMNVGSGFTWLWEIRLQRRARTPTTSRSLFHDDETAPHQLLTRLEVATPPQPARAAAAGAPGRQRLIAGSR